MLNGKIIAPTKKCNIRKSDGNPLAQSGKKSNVIKETSIFINQKKRNVKEWQMQANERIKHDPKQLSKALKIIQFGQILNH